MNVDQMQNLFIIALGCLFIFVLLRELMCWYWKINKHIALQEKILHQLKLSNKYASNAELDRL